MDRTFYLTRRSNDLQLPHMRTNWGKQPFIYQASKDWNNLDNDIKNIKSFSFFMAKRVNLKFVKNAIVSICWAVTI